MANNFFRVDMFIDKPWPMNFLMTYNAAISACGPAGNPDGYLIIPDGSSREASPPRDIEPTILYLLANSSRKNAMTFILGYYRDHISSDELAEIHRCTRANVVGIIRNWIETHLSKGVRKLLTYGVGHLVYMTDHESYERGHKAGYENGYYLGYYACQQEQKEMKNKKDNPNAKCALSTTIEELNLSIRTYNCVKRAGVNTIGELITMTKADVKRIRNLGKKSFDELMFKLHTLGYDLAEGEKEE